MQDQAIRKALRAKFPASKVKERKGAGGLMLSYVAGETVIERLQDATNGYAWQAQVVKIEQIEKTKRNGEKYQVWVAVVQGLLLIDGDCGTGVGAMENADVDMAVKSANTEALKNAAKNGFGVGLELWDKDYVAGLGQRRRLESGSEQALKQETWRIAKANLGGTPTIEAVAELFDVDPADLDEPEVLRDILVGEGVLDE